MTKVRTLILHPLDDNLTASRSYDFRTRTMGVVLGKFSLFARLVAGDDDVRVVLIDPNNQVASETS